MLQKGFLMSNKNTQEKKTNKSLLMTGGAVCFIIGAIIIMIHNYYVGLGLIIVGSIMASVGLWMNVLSQNKNRRFN